MGAKSAALPTSLGLRKNHLDSGSNDCFGARIVAGMPRFRHAVKGRLVKHPMCLNRLTPMLLSVRLRPGRSFASLRTCRGRPTPAQD